MEEPKGLIQVIDARCYELYKNGVSVEEISEEVGIPVIRVKEAIHGKLINKIWRTQTMKNLNIKLLSDNATAPTRAYGVSAGLDIYAAETVVIEPQEKILLATDIAVDIPEGYVGLLTSRSGVSSKTHLVVETGKIDAGYNGHVKVNIKNDEQDWYGTKHSERQLDIQGQEIRGSGVYAPYQMSYKINKGDKIAQLVITPIVTPKVNVVEEFNSESVRGTNGFGSSGY